MKLFFLFGKSYGVALIGKYGKNLLESFIELLQCFSQTKTLNERKKKSLRKMQHSSHGYIYISERFYVIEKISHRNNISFVVG